MNKVVDDLTFTKQLGDGAFGEVYLTRIKNDNNYYATKIVPKCKVLQDASIYRFFKNELNIIEKIQHPNIIKYYGKRVKQDAYYLIFELCNGGTLTNYLVEYMKSTKKPLTEDLVQKIFIQMANGVKYLHDLKIIHRDLKLDNILLDFPESSQNKLSSLRVKIIDFGFARYLDDNEMAQSVVGSALNMDPRIFKKYRKALNGEFWYDKTADIWSLGTILFELLIGSPPYYAKTYDELLMKLEKGEYSIPTKLKLSREAVSLINGMLRADSNQRLTIDQILQHPFLTKDPSHFMYLDLNYIKSKNIDLSSKIVMSSNEENDIWRFYESEEISNLSEIYLQPKNEPRSGLVDEFEAMKLKSKNLDSELDGKKL